MDLDKIFNNMNHFEDLEKFFKKIQTDPNIHLKDNKYNLMLNFKKRISEGKNVSFDNPCVIRFSDSEHGYFDINHVKKIISLFKFHFFKNKKREDGLNDYWDRWL